MTLSQRLLLILIVLLGGAFFILAVGGQYFVRQWVEANLLESAEKVRNVLMATRRVYQHQFIDNDLPINEKTLGLLPAHALHRISNDLQHWDKSGFTFNNVSDQPRNPFNKADAIEMAAIEHFRANPDAELRFMPFTNTGGEHYYLYARPIRVEKYCLQCHGNKEEAPETIRLLYDEAFGYQEGDLRGILSIKVPAASLEAQAQASLLALLGVGIIMLGLLGVGIAWTVSRNVLRPLTVLEGHIHDVASGDLSKRIIDLKGEFAQVGEAYNRMAAKLTLEKAGRMESENRFRTIFEQTAIGIALVGPDGRWLNVNKKLCDFLGYTETELLAKTFQDITHPDDLTADTEHVQRMLNLEIDSYAMDKRYIRKDGKVVWATLTVSLVWATDGRPDYFISAIEDISDRKAIELARQQNEATEQELRARNKELERFNQAMIGRELDMVELKQRINALSKELGHQPPFDLSFLDQSANNDKAPHAG